MMQNQNMQNPVIRVTENNLAPSQSRDSSANRAVSSTTHSRESSANRAQTSAPTSRESSANRATTVTATSAHSRDNSANRATTSSNPSRDNSANRIAKSRDGSTHRISSPDRNIQKNKTGDSNKQKAKPHSAMSLPESNVQLQRMTSPEISQALKNAQLSEINRGPRNVQRNDEVNKKPDNDQVKSANATRKIPEAKGKTMQPSNSKEQNRGNISIMSPKPSRENVKNTAETGSIKEKNKTHDASPQGTNKPSNKTTATKNARRAGQHIINHNVNVH